MIHLLFEEIKHALKQMSYEMPEEHMLHLARRLAREVGDWRNEIFWDREFRSEVLRRLDRIENLRHGENQCMFADSDGGRYQHWISKIASDVSHGEATPTAGAGGFWEKMADVAKLGSRVVLVDPYALAATTDDGKAVSPVPFIEKVLKDCSLGQLELYCRQDSCDQTALAAVKQKYSKKIVVRFGDLHDRYLLVGSDSKIKHPSNVRLTEPWRGLVHWAGVVFGASLNGVQKRPTYVLPFDNQDIEPIQTYLDRIAP
jgi:hypothetical protein